jgi:hypothetical protein
LDPYSVQEISRHIITTLHNSKKDWKLASMIEPKLGFESFLLVCLLFCLGRRFRVLEGNIDWRICLRNSAFASNSRSSGQGYREIERHKNLQLSGVSRHCTAFCCISQEAKQDQSICASGYSVQTLE